MSDKLHWFHCSEKYHGQRWVAERKTPELVLLTTEPTTPRLCVASSVARCFASRLFTRDVFVYRTETPRRAIKPVDVHDSVITQERWLIPPVAMVMTDVIPWRMSRRACAHSLGVIRRQMKQYEDPRLTPIDRLKTFQRIIEVLGDQFCDRIDRRFVAMSLAYFEAKQAKGAA